MWSRAVMTCTICIIPRSQEQKQIPTSCCCADAVTRSCTHQSTIHVPGREPIAELPPGRSLPRWETATAPDCTHERLTNHVARRPTNLDHGSLSISTSGVALTRCWEMSSLMRTRTTVWRNLFSQMKFKIFALGFPLNAFASRLIGKGFGSGHRGGIWVEVK